MGRRLDLWASKTEWARRGYSVDQSIGVPFLERTYNDSRGPILYPAYHAYHVRIQPEEWSRLVGLLSPAWHHLGQQQPDQATAAVVHDLLVEQGDDYSAARLRWAVLGTEEQFQADLAAHNARLRVKEEKAKAREASRWRWEPIVRRRKARQLARQAACWTAEGIQESLCLIPVDLDWQDRPTLMAHLRDRGRASLAEQLASANGDELCVRSCWRKNRLELCRVVRTYRGLSAEEWERHATSNKPVPDAIVELLLGAAS